MNPTAHPHGATHHLEANPAADVAAALPSTNAHLDANWMLLSGFSIVLIQLAFAFYYAGSARYKNAQSVVIKVLIGLFSTVLIWWLFGYGFAYGYDGNNQFLGGTKLANAGWEATSAENDYANFVLRAGAAAVSVNIIIGGAAERMTFIAWTILSTAFSGFIYPALVHWVFNSGWLSTYGFKDFAGSGVVAFAGGVGAFLTTLIVKARKNRFDHQLQGTHTHNHFPHHSPLFISFGAVLFLFGFLFFNAGVVVKGDDSPFKQALVAVNTLIGAAAGGLFGFISRYFQNETTSLPALSRGIIAGVVVVAGSANEILSWEAFIYGALAGILVNLLVVFFAQLHIDDPAEVLPVFLGAGFLGIILTGFFDRVNGLFYGGGAKLIGLQLLGLLVIFAWVGFFVILVLLTLKGFGILRVSEDAEAVGIDKYQCQGEAIEFDNRDGATYGAQHVEVPVPSNRIAQGISNSVFDPARSRGIFK